MSLVMSKYHILNYSRPQHDVELRSGYAEYVSLPETDVICRATVFQGPWSCCMAVTVGAATVSEELLLHMVVRSGSDGRNKYTHFASWPNNYFCIAVVMLLEVSRKNVSNSYFSSAHSTRLCFIIQLLRSINLLVIFCRNCNLAARRITLRRQSLYRTNISLTPPTNPLKNTVAFQISVRFKKKKN